MIPALVCVVALQWACCLSCLYCCHRQVDTPYPPDWVRPVGNVSAALGAIFYLVFLGLLGAL